MKTIKFILFTIIINSYSYSQEWKVILYDKEFNPKGMFSIPMDSTEYVNHKYLEFDSKYFFKNFEGCYIRLIPKAKVSKPKISNDIVYLKESYSVIFETKESESLDSVASIKDFEKYYLKSDNNDFDRIGFNRIEKKINLPDGRWIKINKQKQKLYEFEIIEQKLDGFLYIFFPNTKNKPKLATFFSNGVWSKIEIGFEINGEISYIYNPISDYNYYNVFRKSNGIIKTVDFPDNFSILYDNEKRIEKYFTTKKGEKNGSFYCTYNDDSKMINGEVTMKGNYENGKLNGSVKYFDKDNIKIKEEFYENGVLIWTK